MNLQDINYYFNQYTKFYPTKEFNVLSQPVDWYLFGENKRNIELELLTDLKNYILPEIERYYGHINWGFDILIYWTLKPKYNDEKKNYDQLYRLKIHFIFRLPGSKKLSDIEFIYQIIEGGETKLELDHTAYKNRECKEVTTILQRLLENLK